MLPSFASSSPAHSHKADAEARGKLLEGRGRTLLALLADSYDSLVCQFREMLFCSAHPRAALFLNLVIGIGFVVTEEQVARTNAGSVVAVMTDEHSLRDGSVFKFPSDTVSREGGKLSFGTITRTRIDHPVSGSAEVASPQPTTCFDPRYHRAIVIDPAPKPRCIWKPQSSLCTAHNDGLVKPRRKVK